MDTEDSHDSSANESERRTSPSPPRSPASSRSAYSRSRSCSPKKTASTNDVGPRSPSPPHSSVSTSSSSSSSKNDTKNDGSTSDSSEGSLESSRHHGKSIDTQPEAISDGDIVSDDEKKNVSNDNMKKNDINITHEDLSDVSDLEEPMDDVNVDEKPIQKSIEIETNERGEEEQLDFEAEDGECEADASKEKDEGEDHEDGEMNEKKEPDELEEGEVTDEDEVRPEETEPRPVCRFFSRGQCTWGASCRFLHPGVTDKGNYTMFEMIRPVVPGEYGREERPATVGYGRSSDAAPPIESAWERGLRTAKEMLRKSIKRKEQDIDFEEKKMNLSLAQEEFDKENGYYGRVPSPEPRYMRHVPVDYGPIPRAVDEYYGHRPVLYEPEYVPPPRERMRSYRELPPHRMPDYYNSKYEEEPPVAANKVRKPKREVIVQKAEERPVRGDEWSDPWMRSKSPAGRKTAGRKRSYSSGSSYSSSSSSHSSSDSSRSTYRSRSRSSKHKRTSHRSRHVSPSVIVSERKAANERAALMNPPAPKKRAPSPGMMRVGAANPPAPSRDDKLDRTRSKLAVAAALARVKNRRHSSKSSSDSSGSSSSDSDSSASSSSSSRDGSPPPPSRRSAHVDLSLAKAMDALKGQDKRQIKLNLKNAAGNGTAASSAMGTKKMEISDVSRKAEAMQGGKKRIGSPPQPPAGGGGGAVGDAKTKKATSRREELLKQLKAVEDAIAKKRSKVN